MVVVIELLPEEFTIARDGEIPEPSFRPFPGSARDREEDLAGRDEVEERIPGEPAAPAGLSFQRVASAQTWKRHSVTAAVLVASVDGEAWIVGLGTFEGGSRGKARGTRNMEIHVGRLLTPRIPAADVIGAMDELAQNPALTSTWGLLRPLPPKVTKRFLAVLERLVPGARDDLLSFKHQAEQRRWAARRIERSPARPLREAAASALHLFTAGWYRLVPSPTPDPYASALAAYIDDRTILLENDVVTDDAGVFPEWDRATHSRRGWWEFHHHNRRLLVKNINVSPQEARTGADLVYLRTDPDAFVLVQYKLTERLSDGRVIYRPNDRLADQVKRMLALEGSPRGAVDADAEDTYRLGAGFTFVKFVRSEGPSAQKPGELTPGCYMPTELVRRMLLNPGKGPRGGAVHYVEEKRSMTSENFAHLVRNCLVGSTGDATSKLMDLFGLQGLRHVVVAVDEPLDGSPQR